MNTDAEHAIAGMLMLGGRPASRSLGDTTAVTNRVLTRLMQRLATCRALPGEEVRGDVTAIIRDCVERAAATLDDPRADPDSTVLATAGAQWAGEGIPLHAVHHAIYEGVKVLFDLVAAQADPADTDALRTTTARLAALSVALTATVSSGYVRQTQTMVGEEQAATRDLADALLAGRDTRTMAKERGIRVEPAYFVIAVAFSRAADGGSGRAVGAGRTAGAVRAELCRHSDRGLTLLTDDGGTILLPTTFGDDRLDSLVEQLSVAGRASTTATVIESPTAGIPRAHRHVQELLDLACRTRRGPGLFRLSDMALEYQLTRPGYAHQSLTALLNPLQHHPELLQTLREYLDSGLDRRRTARKLYIHPNTVANRFRRIAELTGVDPSDRIGIWYFHSALVIQAE